MVVLEIGNLARLMVEMMVNTGAGLVDISCNICET